MLTETVGNQISYQHSGRLLETVQKDFGHDLLPLKMADLDHHLTSLNNQNMENSDVSAVGRTGKTIPFLQEDYSSLPMTQLNQPNTPMNTKGIHSSPGPQDIRSWGLVAEEEAFTPRNIEGNKLPSQVDFGYPQKPYGHTFLSECDSAMKRLQTPSTLSNEKSSEPLEKKKHSFWDDLETLVALPDHPMSPYSPQAFTRNPGYEAKSAPPIDRFVPSFVENFSEKSQSELIGVEKVMESPPVGRDSERLFPSRSQVKISKNQGCKNQSPKKATTCKEINDCGLPDINQQHTSLQMQNSPPQMDGCSDLGVGSHVSHARNMFSKPKIDQTFGAQKQGLKEGRNFCENQTEKRTRNQLHITGSMQGQYLKADKASASDLRNIQLLASQTFEEPGSEVSKRVPVDFEKERSFLRSSTSQPSQCVQTIQEVPSKCYEQAYNFHQANLGQELSSIHHSTMKKIHNPKKIEKMHSEVQLRIDRSSDYSAQVQSGTLETPNGLNIYGTTPNVPQILTGDKNKVFNQQPHYSINIPAYKLPTRLPSSSFQQKPLRKWDISSLFRVSSTQAEDMKRTSESQLNLQANVYRGFQCSPDLLHSGISKSKEGCYESEGRSSNSDDQTICDLPRQIQDNVVIRQSKSPSHSVPKLRTDVSEQMHTKEKTDYMSETQKQGQRDGSRLSTDEVEVVRTKNSRVQALGKHLDAGSGIPFAPNNLITPTFPDQTSNSGESGSFEKTITSPMVNIQQRSRSPNTPESIRTPVDLIKHLPNQRLRGTHTGNHNVPKRGNLGKEGQVQSTDSISSNPISSCLPTLKVTKSFPSSSQDNPQTRPVKLDNPVTTGTSKAGELDKGVIGSNAAATLSNMESRNSQEKKRKQRPEIRGDSSPDTSSMRGPNHEAISKKQRAENKVPCYLANEGFPISDSDKESFLTIQYFRDRKIPDLQNHQLNAESAGIAKCFSEDLLKRFYRSLNRVTKLPASSRSSSKNIWNVETVLPFVYCILSQKPPFRVWENLKDVTAHTFLEYHCKYFAHGQSTDRDHLARFLMWHTQIIFRIIKPLYNLTPQKIDENMGLNIKYNLHPIAEFFLLIHIQKYHEGRFSQGANTSRKKLFKEHLELWENDDSHHFPGEQYKVDGQWKTWDQWEPMSTKIKDCAAGFQAPKTEDIFRALLEPVPNTYSQSELTVYLSPSDTNRQNPIPITMDLYTFGLGFSFFMKNECQEEKNEYLALKENEYHPEILQKFLEAHEERRDLKGFWNKFVIQEGQRRELNERKTKRIRYKKNIQNTSVCGEAPKIGI
ncbi:hypothetical protein CROQUDRAFT_695420 [Cronartium quercuum f. sp. fusiforme G11]|uniref:Uncharacterized protein n=1 Tax=Cronartium quercuum f. sp. fusiforme G11 TaxID=708437 RepID=A0A9P6NLD2_9BASI|nr:hypothetical protein CROQUDRAFT_695420 [Cronartium quercuum f. sp. fusiforme G11]